MASDESAGFLPSWTRSPADAKAGSWRQTIIVWGLVLVASIAFLWIGMGQGLAFTEDQEAEVVDINIHRASPTNQKIQGDSYDQDASTTGTVKVPAEDVVQLHELVSMDELNKHLDEILIVRTPGTPGHDTVRDYLLRKLSASGWAVERHDFTAEIPNGEYRDFTNIIARLNPDAKGPEYVLSAHWDSMNMTSADFLGATDSAYSVAMLVHMAEAMYEILKSSPHYEDIRLTVLLFDGEEAFVRWTNKDSIYGARYLAQKWEEEGYLKNIKLLVLFDLLGWKGQRVSYAFQNTNDDHKLYHEIENFLDDNDLLAGEDPDNGSIFVEPKFRIKGSIGDDHIPFLRRGVPILHHIAYPFPDVWHKPSDNRDALDETEMINTAMITFYYVAKLMGIASPAEEYYVQKGL
eukprot:Clim_evm94s152 gene=Clim_evmTU94s152